MLVLSDQETPDKTPEHYIDVKFDAQSKYHIHSGQFPTIPDTIWDAMCEIVRFVYNNQLRIITTPTSVRRRVHSWGIASMQNLRSDLLVSSKSANWNFSSPSHESQIYYTDLILTNGTRKVPVSIIGIQEYYLGLVYW